jgi:two-component system KDP operon response regulator KdpE
VIRVLVVDDDVRLQRTLTIALRAHGNDVVTANDGRTAIQAVEDETPDVVILDLGLPDIDGTEVLRHVRTSSRVPVIVLSARHDSDDKIEALDLGADVARGLGTLSTADFTLDFAERRAPVADAEIRLTPTEWRLLEEPCRDPGHLVSEQELLHTVWGPSIGVRTVLDVGRGSFPRTSATPVHGVAPTRLGRP